MNGVAARPAIPASRPAAPRARLVLRPRHLAAIAALLPLVLVGAFVTTNVRASTAQRSLRQQWAALAEAPLDAAGLSTASIAQGEPVARLVVAAAGIDLIVVEGGDAHRGPVHRPASARPGLPGVTVIAAGRFGYGNMFLNLPRLVRGDVVTLETRAGPKRFTVTGTSVTAASAIDSSIDTPTPTVLLVSPERAWGSTNWIVVRAEAAT